MRPVIKHDKLVETVGSCRILAFRAFAGMMVEVKKTVLRPLLSRELPILSLNARILNLLFASERKVAGARQSIGRGHG